MEILVIFVLTLINGIFALSEIALVSLKRNRIEQLEQKGNTRARIVLELLEAPENFLSSIQVGITLIGVVAGAYGGTALADDVEPFIRNFPLLAPYAEGLSISLIVGLITYFTIVIGELIPKTIALRNAERVALTVAPFIKYFSKVTYPIVSLLSFSTTALLRLLGIKEAQEENMTEDELRALVKSAGKKGVLEWEESLMHQNLFVFSEQRAKNLMTHRTEVEWFDMHQSVEQLSDKIRASAHSKFLVCDGTIDKIQGIVTAKEFFEKKNNEGFTLESILQEPIYVPETMYTLDILTLFKRAKEYIAVVVDEFGSVEGIITLHDLMEAIVGDLPDIDEVDDPEFVEREDHSYLVSGSISIHQFNAYLEKDLIAEEADHYTTLGGFIISYLNKIPATGEKFDYRDYSFEVVDLDGQRIDKVIVVQEKGQSQSSF